MAPHVKPRIGMHHPRNRRRRLMAESAGPMDIVHERVEPRGARVSARRRNAAHVRGRQMRQAVPSKARSSRLSEEGSSVDMNNLARDVARTGATKESHCARDIGRSAVRASKRVMNAVVSRLREVRITCRLD
jgi:hypothetical protein